jgi:hypothetical protein
MAQEHYPSITFPFHFPNPHPQVLEDRPSPSRLPLYKKSVGPLFFLHIHHSHCKKRIHLTQKHSQMFTKPRLVCKRLWGIPFPSDLDMRKASGLSAKHRGNEH